MWPPSSMTGMATSYGRRRWLEAGQDLLRRGGVGAVKLRALTRRCQLTTGSFYHHFSGMSDYLDALARYHGAQHVAQVMAFVDDPDPVVRLRRLSDLSRHERLGPLDHAMRDWAGSSPVAASAVRDADQALCGFLERAFLDLGHDTDGARTRALLMLSTGVARLHVPWPIPADVFDQVFAVVGPVAAPMGGGDVATGRERCSGTR